MDAMYYEYEEATPYTYYDDTEENQLNLNQEYYAINLVYSPAQPLLKKNNYVIPFELDPDMNQFKRKAQPMTSNKSKRVCLDNTSFKENNIPSTAYNSDQEQECSELDQPYMEGDLEQLVNSIGRESMKIPYIPSQVEVNNLWSKLLPDHIPSLAQDAFLSTYLNKDEILKVKFALDDEILYGLETVAFESWVESLCQKDNVKAIKEMARRQKVYRYLEKKHGRTYSKKVHYQIRQRVAEERLRVKGRFVTWGQALEMLNETNKRQYNVNDYYQIKKKLTEKFGSCKQSKF